jgi:hypothetical protein
MFADDALDDSLQLPDEFHHVQAFLHTYDPDLRLRASAERPGWFVLERRCRRAPAVNTGMQTYTDMHVQARDGYIHVSAVHPEWLFHPWNIVTALREEGFDTWAAGGWESVVDEIEYEERWQAETRRRRRREDGRAHYREVFDILSRIGNGDGTEVTRFNNPGGPQALSSSAGPAPSGGPQ